MSYWLYLEIDTGGTSPAGVADWNYTSNVATMWRKAGADLALFDGKLAADCLPVLLAAIDRMTASPDEYKAMDSNNGWGTYESLLPHLRELAEKMEKHPKTTIRVSR